MVLLRRSLSSTKTVQVECSSMSVKRSFDRDDIAETPPVFYKDSANEWKESLLLLSRVPPVFYKDTYNILLHPKPDTSF